MNTYTVRSSDQDFLSVPRYDTISTAPIRPGDSICVCDSCGAIHLAASWNANNNCCGACNSAKTKLIDERFLRQFHVSKKMVSGRNRTQTSSAPSSTPTRRRHAQWGNVESVPSSSSAQMSARRHAQYINVRNAVSAAAELYVNSSSEESATNTVGSNAESRVNTTVLQSMPTRRAKRHKGGLVLLYSLLTFVILGLLVMGSYFVFSM